MNRYLLLYILLYSIVGISQQTEILYLPFNNNAVDQSKNSLKSREYGNVKYTEDRFGTPCSALYLDGKSFVEVENNYVFSSINKSFTVSAWFKLDKNSNEDSWVTLVCKAEDNLSETANSPHFRVQWFQGKTQSTISINTEFTEFDKGYSNHILESGKWMHMALVYDAQNVVVYLNGINIWSFPYHGSMNINSAPLFVGKDYPGAVEYFKGAIDDLHIYNFALPKNQVDQLFHADPDYKLEVNNIYSPDDINAETDKGKCGKNVNYFNASINSCKPDELKLLEGKRSGEFFPVGETKNVLKITRGENEAVLRNIVTVTDKEKPTIACPKDQTFEAINGTWTQKQWDITYTDNCEVKSFERIDAYKSTDKLSPGTYEIKYKAVDASLNESICSFNVTVKSTVKNITLTCPIDQEVWTDNEWTYKESWELKYDKSIAVSSIERIDTYKERKTFLPGTYELKYKLTDTEGNTAECSFQLIVKKKEKKVEVVCPEDKIVFTENDEWDFKEDWKLNYDNSIEVKSIERIDAHKLKKSFAVGTYEIQYKLTDINDNSAICSFNLIVKKKLKPIKLDCPDDITVYTDSEWKVEENWKLKYDKTLDVASIERVDANRFKKSFAPGTYEIKYKITDASNRTAYCSFDITVVKNPEKVIVQPVVLIPCPQDTTVNVVGSNWIIEDFWLKGFQTNPKISAVKRIDSYVSQNELGTGTYKFKYEIVDNSGKTSVCSPNISIQKEEIKIKMSYEFKSEEVIMVIYDNKTQDGDRISVYFNGEKIEDNYTIQNKEVGVLMKRLKIESGKENVVVIQALNMGDVGKNTVQVDFYDKEKKNLLDSKPEYSKVYESTPGYSSGINLISK